MRTSAQGIIEIASHEGIVPAPYKDSVGVWTYGVGHTAAAGGLDPQEMNSAMPIGTALDAAIDRALILFQDDLVKYEDGVLRALKGAPVKQHQFDALVSWHFNTGGAARAKLMEQIRSGDYSGSGFMGWLRPPEIRNRREAEMRLFQTGHYSATKVPIWRTNGKGKLAGILRSMDSRELLERMERPAVQDAAPAGFWEAVVAVLKKMFGGKS